jgi:hypothetical protein
MQTNQGHITTRHAPKQPRYYFQLSGGYMTPADRIMGKRSTFMQRTLLRIKSHALIAEREMYRIGIAFFDLY